MRKLIISAAILFTVSVSCSDISFIHSHKGSDGLDFTSGTWLVNEVETENTLDSKENLTGILLEKLNEMGGRSIKYIESVNDRWKLPQPLLFHTDPVMLDSISVYFDYDYLFNVKTSTEESESGGIAFGEQDLEHQVRVEILVFDINNAQMIYYKDIEASEEWPISDEMEEKPSRFSFTRSSENLLERALKKGLKDLKRESITVN